MGRHWLGEDPAARGSWQRRSSRTQTGVDADSEGKEDQETVSGGGGTMNTGGRNQHIPEANYHQV